jgi:hypothetical protein
VALIVIVAAIASAFGGSPALPSLAGVWTYETGETMTFTPSGSGGYTISMRDTVSPQCPVADDGTVTSSSGQYEGSINLYPISGSSPDTCSASEGVAQITITVAKNGNSANVATVAENGVDCSDCGQRTMTRLSDTATSR